MIKRIWLIEPERETSEESNEYACVKVKAAFVLSVAYSLMYKILLINKRKLMLMVLW